MGIAQFGTDGVLLRQRDISAAAQGKDIRTGFTAIVAFLVGMLVAGGNGIAPVFNRVQRGFLGIGRGGCGGGEGKDNSVSLFGK